MQQRSNSHGKRAPYTLETIAHDPGAPAIHTEDRRRFDDAFFRAGVGALRIGALL